MLIGKNKLAQSPYSDLPDRSYWRTGVTNSDPAATTDFYIRKFPIKKTHRIATAGSCFAQHIARNMRARGFKVLDVEPPPPRLSQETAMKFGHNIYSARYGNIYVVRQLLQLFDEAFAPAPIDEEPWERDGRYFDPFRPNVEPRGLVSPEEVRQHRHQHLRAVRTMFTSADIFIFTLGLTESWMNAETGVVYPVAPGVIAGNYDPEIHVFKNFTSMEIRKDLRQFRAKLKRRNPRVKFLLTVSPVPLTATASDHHVLPATIYSKSVLRTVAGEAAAEFPDVDYFPSYDLIASHWSQGAFYNANLRTVTDDGVGAAMRAFFLQHDPGAATAAESTGSRPRAGAEAEEERDDELVCEEMLLDAFAK